MNTTFSDGGPAFPCDELHDQTPPYRHLLAHQGMTLRDYFAAKAMQGMLADSSFDPPLPKLAEGAYRVADAMLEARQPDRDCLLRELVEALDGMLQVYGGKYDNDCLPKNAVELELIDMARAALARAKEQQQLGKQK